MSVRPHVQSARGELHEQRAGESLPTPGLNDVDVVQLPAHAAAMAAPAACTGVARRDGEAVERVVVVRAARDEARAARDRSVDDRAL